MLYALERKLEDIILGQIILIIYSNSDYYNIMKHRKLLLNLICS